MTTPDLTPDELREAAQRARESVDSWPAFLFDRAADELERLRESLAEECALRVSDGKELERLRAQVAENEGMAGCMNMFRTDMIDAGVIDKSVPPMMMTEAIMRALAASPTAPAQQAPSLTVGERERFEARFAHLRKYPEVTPEVRNWMWFAWQAALAPAAQAEPVAWEAPEGLGIVRFVTDARYRKFSPAIQAHYKPYRCASCASNPPAQWAAQPAQEGDK